jgi:hypothetical protein
MAEEKKLGSLPPPARIAEEDKRALAAKLGFFRRHRTAITIGLPLFTALCSSVQLLRNTVEPWRPSVPPSVQGPQTPVPKIESPELARGKEPAKEAVERLASKVPEKSEWLTRMENGKLLVTTPTQLAHDPTMQPWVYGYGVKFIEQGDSDGQVKTSWHMCPDDLSKAPPGIRKQCLATPEDRRRNPLVTSDLQ